MYVDLVEAWDVTMDPKLREAIVNTYQNALTTEYTCICLVHFSTFATDKVKLRGAMVSTLKTMNSELKVIKDATNQTLSGIDLFHKVLKTRIDAALKLK